MCIWKLRDYKTSIHFICVIYLLIFLWSWGLNSGSHVAREAVYHLGHSTSPCLCNLGYGANGASTLIAVAIFNFLEWY
jgi:hypothetical protein